MSPSSVFCFFHRGIHSVGGSVSNSTLLPEHVLCARLSTGKTGIKFVFLSVPSANPTKMTVKE